EHAGIWRRAVGARYSAGKGTSGPPLVRVARYGSGCAVAAAAGLGFGLGLAVGEVGVGTEGLLDLLGGFLALGFAFVHGLLEVLDRAADIAAERAELLRAENEDDHGQDDQPVPDAQ